MKFNAEIEILYFSSTDIVTASTEWDDGSSKATSRSSGAAATSLDEYSETKL